MVMYAKRNEAIQKAWVLCLLISAPIAMPRRRPAPFPVGIPGIWGHGDSILWEQRTDDRAPEPWQILGCLEHKGSVRPAVTHTRGLPRAVHPTHPSSNA